MASAIFLVIFLLSVFMLAYKTQPAKASSPTIYINPDGRITPPSANITTSDNVTYTFTGNNYLPIVVNRSDIIIDGRAFILQATSNNGFSLFRISNVTIRNVTVTNCNSGILCENCANDTFSENTITSSMGGVYLASLDMHNVISNNSFSSNIQFDISVYDGSVNNTVSDNSMTTNASFHVGIAIQFCSNNTFYGNNISRSGSYNSHGFALFYASDNFIFNNSVATDYGSIIIANSTLNNRIYHNIFASKIVQVTINAGYNFVSSNIWDNGYPSGGNYWSDYTTMYPKASEIDSSGIWNTPYVIDANNTDHYPLMNQPIIPESPSYLVLSIMMIATLLAVAIYRRKHLYYKSSG